VQVHCNEGLANHIGPEPCACIREDAGEASAEECTGTENGVEEADAPPHPGGGKMARPSGSGVLPVPRCADQRPPAVRIPLLCGAAVVANAETSQSTRWLQCEARESLLHDVAGGWAVKRSDAIRPLLHELGRDLCSCRRSIPEKNGPARRGQNRRIVFARAVNRCRNQTLCTCTGLEKISRP